MVNELNMLMRDLQATIIEYYTAVAKVNSSKNKYHLGLKLLPKIGFYY